MHPSFSNFLVESSLRPGVSAAAMFTTVLDLKNDKPNEEKFTF